MSICVNVRDGNLSRIQGQMFSCIKKLEIL